MFRLVTTFGASGLVGLLCTLMLAQPAAGPAPKAPPAAAQPGGNVPSGHPQIMMPTIPEEWPKAKPEDVSSVDAIVKAFYAIPAGEPNQAREWDRFRSLFAPDARLIPARQGQGGAAGAYFLSVSDYIEANRTYFEKGGFHDTEIGRRVEEFGSMAHVWSTYESRHKTTDIDPYSRGINSIQLLKDGDRWWIINAFWDHERPEAQIPEKYLSTPK